MKPLENTFILEGLIQGPLPDTIEAAELLQEYVADLARSHLRLSLEINGGQFSLLGDATPHQCSHFQPLPVPGCVKQAIERLLVRLPLPERSEVFSTLRSKEFQPGVEQQALYTITPTGEVHVHLRETPAEVLLLRTVRSNALKRRLIIGGLSLLVLGIGSQLIDFKQAFLRLGEPPPVQKLGEISIDTTVMAQSLRAIANVKKGPVLEITLVRGPQWETIFQSTPTASPADWNQHLAATTLHRGYAMALLKDADGNLLRAQPIDLKSLRTKQETTVKLPLTSSEIIHSVQVSP